MEFLVMAESSFHSATSFFMTEASCFKPLTSCFSPEAFFFKKMPCLTADSAVRQGKNKAFLSDSSLRTHFHFSGKIQCTSHFLSARGFHFQTQLVTDHRDEFAVRRLSARIVDGVAEIGIQYIDIANPHES
jgi:hypothetical protein